MMGNKENLKFARYSASMYRTVFHLIFTVLEWRDIDKY